MCANGRSGNAERSFDFMALMRRSHGVERYRAGPGDFLLHCPGPPADECGAILKCQRADLVAQLCGLGGLRLVSWMLDFASRKVQRSRSAFLLGSRSLALSRAWFACGLGWSFPDHSESLPEKRTIVLNRLLFAAQRTPRDTQPQGLMSGDP